MQGQGAPPRGNDQGGLVPAVDGNGQDVPPPGNNQEAANDENGNDGTGHLV